MKNHEIYGYQEYARGLMNLASSMSEWMGPSFCDAYCYLPEEFETEFIRDMKMKKMPVYEECPDSDREIFAQLFGREEKQLLDSLQYWLGFELGTFEKAYRIIDEEKPDIVLVHGDTSTTFVTSLACFYLKIPVGHVEAGLRTYDIFSP